MAYVIDRRQALYADDIVVVLSVRQRRARSRAVLRDNSLYQTLTRTATWSRHVNGSARAIVQIGARRRRPAWTPSSGK